MKCPHCSAELRYRERSGRRCSHCKQQFALEPRTDRLKLHDLRLRQLDQKLSAEGKLFYSADQLRYAAARKQIAAQDRSTETLGRRIGRFIFSSILITIVLIGLITITTIFPPLGLALMLAISGLLLVLLALRMLRGWHRYPRVPVSADEFTRIVLTPYQKLYGQGLPGLIDAQQRARLDPGLPGPQQLRGALICADPAVRECLLANQVPTNFGLAVLPAAAPFSAPEQAQLAALRERPQLPLLLLHDASPAGCLLAQQVLPALGLAEGRRVLELGLRPRTAFKRKLPILGERPDPALLAQLRQHGKLDAAELAWLEAGKLVPIAALSPSRLLALVEQASARLTAAAPPAAAPLRDQTVGFMNWPT